MFASAELRIDADVLPNSTDENESPAKAATQSPTNGTGDATALDQVQREHIISTLQKSNWVIEGVRGAAARLGLKPATLRHRMKKLGIARERVTGA